MLLFFFFLSFFFFLENEQCEMQEFFSYSVFGPLFFPLSGHFFFTFSPLVIEKKAKYWAHPDQHVGLCGKSESTYLCAQVREASPFFFLALLEATGNKQSRFKGVFSDSSSLFYHIICRYKQKMLISKTSNLYIRLYNESYLLSRSHTFAIIVILDLIPYLLKQIYPRIIMSKSHENILLTIFQKLKPKDQ